MMSGKFLMLRYIKTIIFSIILFCGCSGDDRGLAPVSGTVYLNGKPLPNANIIFTPLEENIRVAVGSTDKEGRYKLTSFQTSDGAKIGKHKVSIRAYEIADETFKPADDITIKKGKLLSPRKYLDPETSGLTADVEKKSNIIDFKLSE